MPWREYAWRAARVNGVFAVCLIICYHVGATMQLGSHMVQIDKNIPICPRGGQNQVSVLDSLEPGDSLIWPGTWSGARTAASKRNTKARWFATRKTPEGIRVWRLK
jgi:hypothetical protein